MKIEDIRSEIETLLSMVSQWHDDEPISHIEHDIALVKLSKIYEGVKFMSPSLLSDDAGALAEATSEELSSDSIASDDLLFSIDLDGISLSADSERGDDLETSVLSFDSEVEPEVVPVSEAETETEIEVVPVAEVAPEPEVVPEPEVSPEPVEPAPRTDNMLFDIDIVPKQSRRRRSVLMSLYNDELASKTVEKEPEPMPVEPSQIEKTEEVTELTEEVAPEPEVNEEVTEVEEPKEEELQVVEEPAAVSVSSVVIGSFVAPTTTVGDLLSRDVETVADRYESDNHTPCVSDVNRCHSFDTLGINERFLLSRDLFGESPVLCRDELNVISQFDNYEDTMIYIAEKYNWNSELEGVKLLLSVIEKKFSIS